jgi:hypothetical protein
MPIDVSASAAGHQRRTARPAPAKAGQEPAQRVWRHALELIDPLAQHDRFALALDLLRSAHHDTATMAHALSVGRNHLRAHPEDTAAVGAITILEEAITFLGVKPRPGDVARPEPC